MIDRKFSIPLIVVGLGALVLSGGCGQNASSPAASKPIKTSIPTAKGDLTRQAKEFLAEGDLPKALPILKTALLANPKDSEAHFLLARVMMLSKNYEQAIAHFNAVIALKPNDADAYLFLAGCYDLSGEKEKAVASVERSIKIYTENRDAKGLKQALTILQGLKAKDISPDDISSVSK